MKGPCGLWPCGSPYRDGFDELHNGHVDAQNGCVNLQNGRFEAN